MDHGGDSACSFGGDNPPVGGTSWWWWCCWSLFPVSSPCWNAAPSTEKAVARFEFWAGSPRPHQIPHLLRTTTWLLCFLALRLSGSSTPCNNSILSFSEKQSEFVSRQILKQDLFTDIYGELALKCWGCSRDFQ